MFGLRGPRSDLDESSQEPVNFLLDMADVACPLARNSVFYCRDIDYLFGQGFATEWSKSDNHVRFL
jgi:hypothetical protein